MRWPWRHRTPQPTGDARASLYQAARALADAERLDCAVRDVAGRLRETRERNHFADAVTRAIRGA